MLRSRTVLFLLAAILVAGGTWAARAATRPAAGPAPAPPRIELDAAPEGGGPLSAPERIAFWTRRVAEQPSDFLSLTQLAVAHADHARRTFDLGGYERATEAVERALVLSPENPATRRVRGAIRFGLHDFDGAIADAERVLERVADDAAALALLADAQLERGDLDAATATLDRLASVAGGSAVEVRQARLAWLRGDSERAVATARRALAAAPDDPTERAFYAYAAAEYARLAGDATGARAAYELALSLDPDSLPAMVGLARVAAFEGDPRAALDLLDRAAAIAPQPEVLALAAQIRRLAGDARGATRAEATIRHIVELAGPAAQVYDRPLLLFALDHGDDATALVAAAQRALAERADSAGHDLVAWAAYRARDLPLAGEESELARAGGSRDARLLYHAGAIALAGGDRDAGRALLESALALGPALDPAERAAAHNLLGADRAGG